MADRVMDLTLKIASAWGCFVLIGITGWMIWLKKHPETLKETFPGGNEQAKANVILIFCVVPLILAIFLALGK